MTTAAEKSDIAAISEDVAALKRDIAALMEHLKAGVVGGTAGAARQATAEIGEEAARLYAKLAAEGARSAQSIGRHVEEQPVTALLVAFILGFVGGRLLSR